MDDKLNSYQSSKDLDYTITLLTQKCQNISIKLFQYLMLKFNQVSANTFLNKNFESKDKFIFKTLNADNKQTVSTLGEIGYTIKTIPSISFNNHKNISGYLESYDWSKPWDAGAQFSSIALYNKIFGLSLREEL